MSPYSTPPSSPTRPSIGVNVPLTVANGNYNPFIDMKNPFVEDSEPLTASMELQEILGSRLPNPFLNSTVVDIHPAPRVIATLPSDFNPSSTVSTLLSFSS